MPVRLLSAAVFLLTSLLAHAAEQFLPYLFDMGTPASELRNGYTRVTHATVYSDTNGFGWDRPAQGSFDDPIPVAEKYQRTHPHWSGPVDNPVLRDGVEDDQPLTFIVQVQPGTYWINLILGRYTRARHDMNIAINGQTVATNIDAWGHVWGSHGGTPTRSLAVVSAPSNGHFRITFSYSDAGKDRWKEYSNRAPEGGKLWFLGTNKVSILGIRALPFIPPKLRLDGAKIIGEVTTAKLRDALEMHNRGNGDEAINQTTNFAPNHTAERVDKASLLESLTGSMSLQDQRAEIALCEIAINEWKHILRADPSAELLALGRLRLESVSRYKQALEYVRMFAYSWANKLTGLNNYHRYWAAYDLCGAITPDEPLYYKALLLRGRVSNWCGREGHWKNCFDLAAAHFAELQPTFPDHPLVKIYTGGKIPAVWKSPAYPANAPEWARLQHEASSRYLELIHYWVNNRQSENGELGGGWGDDVEILRGWAPAVLALNDPLALRGLTKLAEGVWHSGDVTNGFSAKVDDVEHAAELVSDTQPLMCAVDYGNPIYLERCMASMRCMRDVWTAVNSRGHRHFKSHYFSATQVVTNPPRAADVALNGRAANPGIWPLWYNRHPAVEQLLGEWCSAWIEDAFRTDNGKPAGFVPGSIRFVDDRIGGFTDHWWQTRDYFSDFESTGYTATLYNTMVALYAATGEKRFMRALEATVSAVMRDRATTEPGSAGWAAQVCDNSDVADPVEKWRRLSGDDRFDAFLKRRGSAYTKYLLTGEMEEIVNALKKVINGLSFNIEMSTSEVLFTDRVNLPGSDILFEMMTGSVGTPTYYPMHAVTWKASARGLTAFVEDASTTRLRVKVYAFSEVGLSAQMQLWQLEPGDYEMKLENSRSSTSRVRVKERGQKIDLQIPPQSLFTIEFVRKTPLQPKSLLLPDGALGPDAISLAERPRANVASPVQLTVHNIGRSAAKNISGKIYENGNYLGRIKWGDLQAPLELQPKIARTTFSWKPKRPGNHVLRLVLDVADKEDLVSLNNEREITVSVE